MTLLRSPASPLAACLLVATACGAGACGAAPGSSSSPSPAPTEAEASGPSAVLPSGAVYRLELAAVPEDQAQGLMYRENLPEKTGMLFVFAELGPHHFWMKNTMIPLDIVWLDEAGKVLFVSANTPPCKTDPCPTYGTDQPVRMVLELAGGMAAKERVEPGSVVVLKDLPS